MARKSKPVPEKCRESWTDKDGRTYYCFLPKGHDNLHNASCPPKPGYDIGLRSWGNITPWPSGSTEEQKTEYQGADAEAAPGPTLEIELTGAIEISLGYD